MLAVSLWQPWATIVIDYGKDIENRTWAPPQRVVGQRIAIHAGRRVDAAAVAAAGPALPDRLPAGVLLGTVRLAGAHHASTCRTGCSEWADPGCWHWVLADPRPLPHPVPCRGYQRLWTVTLIGGTTR